LLALSKVSVFGVEVLLQVADLLLNLLPRLDLRKA